MAWQNDSTDELIADLRRQLAEKDAALALRDEYIRAAEAWAQFVRKAEPRFYEHGIGTHDLNVARDKLRKAGVIKDFAREEVGDHGEEKEKGKGKKE